ncbi:MAG: sigma-54 dependent transcriptional regulator [Polyangia bacterium]
MERILVVDDEEGIRTFIGEALQSEGRKVTLAADGEAAARCLDRESFHLLITDLKMPGLDGMSLLRKTRQESPETEVVVLTAHGTVAGAVEAMKLGAFDYVAKPLSGPDELRLVAGRAIERRRLREEAQRHPADNDDGGIVAVDRGMVVVLNQVYRVAPTDATVLLLGESGTGKEVLARALHRHSKRADGPFVAVNCAAISDTLLESEMFGHEKGSFTGALATRRGRFELADGGTLFLDEVSELKPGLQAKLLRVLQERCFERVGGTRTIEVDVRIVAATNCDLAAELQAGRFREDLYHRLAVFPVRIPPLRERIPDIGPLAETLLARIARQLGRPTLVLADDARARLLAYGWPGNVRELGNVLERAAILCEGTTINADLILTGPVNSAFRAATDAANGEKIEDLEREAIRRMLAMTGGNRKQTAARLGIGLRTLYDKLKLYGL